MRIVLREMIDHARQARMHVAAAEVFRAHHFTGCGFDERRAAQENRPLILDDDRFIAHGRHVGAACRARAHHDGDLRNACRGQIGLIKEDPAEVIAIREHIVLIRQIRTARVDEVDARQMIFGGDFLRPYVLFDGDRIVRPALDRRVVADDHALLPRDAANAGDDTRARRVVVVHAIGRELRELEKRRAWIEQFLDALTRQQFAAARVFIARRLPAAQREFLDLRAKIGDQRFERRRIGAEVVRARIQF